MLNFYLSKLGPALRRFLDAFGHGGSLVALLAIAGGTAYATIYAEFWQWRYAPTVSIGGLVFAFAFAILYETYLTATATESALNALARPQLQLDYDGTDPSCCEQNTATLLNAKPLNTRRQHRVRVTNVCGRTVDDVHVSLVRFNPQNAPFLPAPLAPMRDYATSHAETPSTFSLHPGEVQYVNVVSGWDLADQELYLAYARHLPAGLPRREYTFYLRATGRDVPSVTQAFKVYFADDMVMFDSAAEADWGSDTGT